MKNMFRKKCRKKDEMNFKKEKRKKDNVFQGLRI